jgi:3-deoxy-D-manno-octulosonic-acid transferase
LTEAGGPTPLSLRLYALATGAASPLAPALLRERVKRGKEDPARTGERLGRTSVARPSGGLVWMHGASVGESLSLLPLIDALNAERPDLGLLITSGTRTSAAMMAQRLPARAIHQFAPIDAPAAVAAFLDHWRPGLGVFVESEVWPNLLLAAKARGLKLALLSAKLSDASYRGWRRFPGAARRLLGGFDLILAQDARAAERIADLGGAPAGVADLKFGAAQLPVDEAALKARRAQIGERPVVLAASTHPGEDELILARWRAAASGHIAKPLLVIASRHPERGPAIARMITAQGLPVGLQSGGDAPVGPVFVADVMGELGLWFRLASLAIMGGSFAPEIGGHNPLEPARLGAPFVSGAMVDNWATAYRALETAGATRLLASAEALDPFIAQALGDRAGLIAMAERAQAQVTAKDAAARSALRQVIDLAPTRVP